MVAVLIRNHGQKVDGEIIISFYWPRISPDIAT